MAAATVAAATAATVAATAVAEVRLQPPRRPHVACLWNDRTSHHHRLRRPRRPRPRVQGHGDRASLRHCLAGPQGLLPPLGRRAARRGQRRLGHRRVLEVGCLVLVSSTPLPRPQKAPLVFARDPTESSFFSPSCRSRDDLSNAVQTMSGVDFNGSYIQVTEGASES